MTRAAQRNATRIEYDLEEETGKPCKVMPQYANGRFIGYRVGIGATTSDTWFDLPTAVGHAKHRLLYDLNQ